jgi:hypothetical protein
MTMDGTDSFNSKYEFSDVESKWTVKDGEENGDNAVPDDRHLSECWMAQTTTVTGQLTTRAAPSLVLDPLWDMTCTQATASRTSTSRSP